MTHYCIGKSASQLLACQQCGKNQISCKQCFYTNHRGQNNQVHASKSLDSSDVYRNFLKLIHFEWLVGQKVLKSLGSFSLSSQQAKLYIVTTAFYNSQFYLQLFSDPKCQKSSQQYQVLKQLYLGNQIKFSDLSHIQKVLNQAKTHQSILKYTNKLIQQTQEQKNIKSNLDYYVGADISYLTNFVQQEQDLFVYYVTQLLYPKQLVEDQILVKEQMIKDMQQGKQVTQIVRHDIDLNNQQEVERAYFRNVDGFNIYKYFEWREKKSKRQRNTVYYSKDFTAFLLDYYQRDPSRDMYTLNDYMLYFWEYFQVSLIVSPLARKYINQQVLLYKAYEKLMKQENLLISFVGFNVWKLSNGVSQLLTNLKNHYFLHAFIQGYLRMLIDRTYTFIKPDEKITYQQQTWENFLQFIKDYSILAQQKQQFFDFTKYKSYYLFRKRLQPFHTIMKQDKDWPYNSEWARKFFNTQFQNPSKKLSPKVYKQYFLKLKNQIKQKEEAFNISIDVLKSQLQQEQKQDFYQFIYLNFVQYCKQKSAPLIKPTYIAYKTRVFQTMDLQYIKLTQQKYKRGDFNQTIEETQETQQQEGQKSKIKTFIGETGAKITQGIDQDEENILKDDIQLGLASDDENQDDNCFCCHGDPYNCKNNDCQNMGVCTACCL